jgi:hypothetical protein
VVIFGHDSMGMETALAHVIPTRNTFGIEITRLDMKLLADMLNKKAYKDKELKDLRSWVDRYVGNRLALKNDEDSARFDLSLAMYLIVRDLFADLNAAGGGRDGVFLQQHLRSQRQLPRRAFRDGGRRARPVDDAVHDLPQRRQSPVVHGLPEGLGSVGDQGPGG